MRLFRALLCCCVFAVAGFSFAQDERAFEKRVADAAALYKAGKQDEAIKAFEALHAESPRSYDALSWLGFLYLRTDEAGKAVPLLEQAIAQHPSDIEVLNNLGNAYLATRQPDRALEKYQAILKLSPRMFEPHYNSGTIYLARKQYAQAVSEFQAATRLKPDDAFTHNNLGVAFEARHENDRAAAEFIKAAELRPDNRTFARNAGLALARLRKPEALGYLEKALGDGSDSAVALALGEAYARAGRREDALKYYESLRSIEAKNPTFWFNLAVLRGAMGKTPEAEQAYRRVLELSPNDLDALNNLGLLLFRGGKFEEATTLFDKLSGLNPSSIAAKVNLGSAAANAGQTAKAIAAWKEVIRAEPSRAAIRLQLANALWEQGDVDGARYHYLQILAGNKDNPEALNGIGLCHLKANKLPQAEAAFRSAVEAKPNYIAAYNNLAITLERMKQPVEAIKILEKAQKIAPDDPDIRANLERMRSSG
ncbi:tetratricopeptide repeat protein [Fimbriimonas ginsengisoli]|uniref:TPR repeat-containing protein n=1 Tax=Fimbriimonas ginsengisoli Gsoil 348 TaxID=661478 RepID=A0A068NZ08_FIMGI|nr:tetratricopeptide repeat protein [Fimbriimonas ginsengisoli]AIE87749.1 TPR repeat-containing protein [Fimbriimonas ginsengisoli Gsoil 348]